MAHMDNCCVIESSLLLTSSSSILLKVIKNIFENTRIVKIGGDGETKGICMKCIKGLELSET